MKRLARYLERQLKAGTPAAVAIDNAFEAGLAKPDTQRVRQETEDLVASINGLRRRISSLRSRVRKRS